MAENRVMVSRDAGKCGGPTPDDACDGKIAPGQSINYAGKGRVSHESCGVVSAENAAPSRSRYSRSRRTTYSGGYRSTFRGQCEDAPCCGCCGPDGYSY